MRALLPLILLSGCVDEVAVLFPHDAGAPVEVVVTGGRTLSLGYRHSCDVRAGQVRCWGDGLVGQLARGPLAIALVPSAIDAGVTFVSVSTGEEHSCALSRSGGVWCSGGNGRGQLGVGDLEQRAVFTPVVLPSPALTLTSTSNFTCVTVHDGSAWCWGDNLEGQVGLEDTRPGADQLSPRRVAGTQQWRIIAGGQGHTCGIDVSDALWCWGRNSDHQLGLGDGSPQQVRTLTRIGTRNDWKDVMPAQQGTCALDRLDQLWCWGGTMTELFGAPTGSSPAKIGQASWRSVSVDVFHGCGVQNDGSLWCVGRGIEGQLGLGDLNPRTSFTRVGTESDWSEVQVGRFHSCARKNNGTLYCTGENGDGRLGVSDTPRRDRFTLTR